ncbi:MAG: GNAT family protein, partial [Myxococcota bacterium]
MSDSWFNLLSDPRPWSPPIPLPGPLETARTVVRLYRRGDGPAVHATVASTRATLMPWMAWARTDHMEESDGVYFVERVRRSAELLDCRDFPLGIFDRASGELIGGTGIHRIRSDLHEGEIGYWMHHSRRGQGLCTEAVGALCSAALCRSEAGGWGLRRLVVFNAAANVASRRVCEKLGLRLEMRMREDRYQGPVAPGDIGASPDG